MPDSNNMAKVDFRLLDSLKQLRQMETCPWCGALVSTSDGRTLHLNWHDNLNKYVARVEASLNTIIDYITNPTNGLEKRATDAIQANSAAITQLRSDATNAINQLRSDATTAIQGNTSAINQLRTDATNAINALDARVDALEVAIP